MSVLAFSSDHSWALAANMGPALLYHNHLLKELEHSVQDNRNRDKFVARNSERCHNMVLIGQKKDRSSFVIRFIGCFVTLLWCHLMWLPQLSPNV